MVSLDDKSVHVFGQNGQTLHVLRSNNDDVWSLALNDDTLLCGEIRGQISPWDLATVLGYSSTDTWLILIA